ncbi:class I SAM-dependent DNA methyltransferase [Chitinophaga sp. GbtcB8]|uniref:type I restriction-modification system subunit M n=1 Tax=Chitinophaga sp. GbtcB8 TaxID=2824753 RepID=UPI001C301313|nr:class I SAM-dependent DNA methyltransferase [Chitinophaga sp. GbtcB8]
MLTSELRTDIDKIWNTFWTGGISNPLTVIEQITYLLFIKRLDELQILKEQQSTLLGTPVEGPIYSEDQKELRWSTFKDMEPETMFQLFRKENGVFDFMKNYGGTGSAFARFMKGAVFMIPTARLLSNVVDMLSGIDMKDRDTKGDVYEYLLSKIATAGQNGQFRTPRHIIKMMVEMMVPTTDDVICDPAAGTCGFLVGCAEFLREHAARAFYDGAFTTHFNRHMFMGMEFDPTMIRIGAMNMILHGIEEPDLRDVDALSEANHAFTDQATLMLGNPPFTGSLDKDAVDGSILKMVDSKKTELLFLALILRGLRKGGRAAVIIPDGVLFGSSKAHKQIRQLLIEQHKLEAVISMPSGVFRPYAGVSTGILIFTKTTTGGTDHVWFYDMKADGFSLDDKRQPIPQNDIPDVLDKWKNKGAASLEGGRDTACFFVPVEEIKQHGYDLSINRYKEVKHEEKEYEAPADIIKTIEGLDKDRSDALEQLKKLLAGI